MPTPLATLSPPPAYVSEPTLTGLPGLNEEEDDLASLLEMIGQLPEDGGLPPLPQFNPQITPPDVGQLAGQAGTYIGNLLQQYPGFTGIQQDLAGQIAPDVRQTIEQAAAERGVGLGVQGSQNAEASLLRALGLTSQALRQQGQENLRGAIQALPQLDLGSLFVSPTEQARQQLQRYGLELGEAGAERRAQMEIDAALERQVLGIASTQDLELLRQQHQADIALLEQTGLDRRQAEALAQQAQIEALQQAGMDRRQAAQIAAQLQMSAEERAAATQRQGQALAGQLTQAELQAQTQGGIAAANIQAEANAAAQRLAAQQAQFQATQRAQQAQIAQQRAAEQNAQQAALDYYNRMFGGTGAGTTADPYAQTQALFNQLNPSGRTGTGSINYGQPDTFEDFYRAYDEWANPWYAAETQSGLGADYWTEWDRLQNELAGGAGFNPQNVTTQDLLDFGWPEELL